MISPGSDNATRLQFLRLILRPIVRFCLRGAHPLREFLSILKVVYVQEAKLLLEKEGEKVNMSRLSAFTGVHRKDVAHILKEGSAPEGLTGSILTKVIGQWQVDDRFRTKAGSPRKLDASTDKGSDFAELCISTGKDVRPRAILDELLRAKVVVEKNGKLELVERYNQYEKKPAKRFEFLAMSLSRLIEAAEENLFREPDPRNANLRTEFDNVSKSAIPGLRKFLLEESISFHKRVREHIAQFDRDVNPEPDALDEEAFTVSVLNASVCFPSSDDEL